MKRVPRGLTLMELLVVMGIFSLTVALTSSIFLLSNQAQRRVLAITAAQADLRFALEAVVREVRAGTIDYATYEAAGGVPVPADSLILLSASGSRLEFYAETSPAVCPAGTAKCLAVRVDGVPQAITSTGILLEDLTFFITPQADPFTIDEASGLYKSDEQPLVTLALKVKTQGRKPEDVVTLNAQTTIAARSYVR
ncbi:MAG TPA: prepilin-type N-terminal cleavage/methylation domain-containing protein [Patescibacteria group bacterium]|nr:prepilin-type N-terminal cleavage/methylation domain-containing protein [Patescibacteria group bacterium]